MFYLIRWTSTKEVAGIMNTEAVLSDVDFAKAFSKLDTSDAIRSKLIQIVGWNLNSNQRNWHGEPISQAEYETYRDLHEFKVMKRYG